MSNSKVIKKEKKKEWLVSLTIEISKEDFNKKVDELARKYTKSIQLPGFRKGKVPPSILMKKYGDSIKEEAFNELLDKTYRETLNKEKITPIAVGDITDVNLESLKYTAEVEIMPEINIEKYSDFEIEYKPFKYNEEFINTEIEYLRKSNGEYVPVDRVVNEGDLLVIDMHAEDNERREIKDFTMENFAITLGDGYIFNELEKALIGNKTGSVVDVEMVIPADYKNEKIANKPAKFKITIKEIKMLLLPNLDDEFAKDMGYKDLEDLKKNIKENLENRAKEEERNQKESRLFGRINEENPFELPQSLIKEESKYLTSYFHKREKDQAKLAELEKSYIPMAEMYLKNDIIIDKVAEKEKIEPTEEEITEEIKGYAEKMKMELEKAKEMIEKDGSFGSIKSKIIRRKAMDFLFENNKFVPIKEEREEKKKKDETEKGKVKEEKKDV
ncbi:MAG: trigger factor [Proteobacteria bacterium]|nr:trigger factor [Pseudomonadota bacterium]